MKFYFGVWDLSLHNREVAAFLEDAYTQHRNTLAVLIGAARPTLSETRCRELAMHIAAMIEGLMVFISPLGLRGAKREEFIRGAKDTVIAMFTVEN